MEKEEKLNGEWYERHFREHAKGPSYLGGKERGKSEVVGKEPIPPSAVFFPVLK